MPRTATSSTRNTPFLTALVDAGVGEQAEQHRSHAPRHEMDGDDVEGVVVAETELRRWPKQE